jgi:hypothetical protein
MVIRLTIDHDAAGSPSIAQVALSTDATAVQYSARITTAVQTLLTTQLGNTV